MQVQGRHGCTLSIMSGGGTTLEYPIRKAHSRVQLVCSRAGLISRRPRSKQNGIADHSIILGAT